MKVRFVIDRISLDGFAWSASDRHSFERSFATALNEAVASKVGIPVDAFGARTAGLESLSLGPLDAANPRQAARALASPLASHVLANPGGRSVGAAKAGAT